MKGAAGRESSGRPLRGRAPPPRKGERARRLLLAERVEEALEELRERSAEGAAVVVEGPRDEAALRELGVVGKVFKISAGWSLVELAEAIAARSDEVIMLTDIDHKGEALARRLGRTLGSHGVAVDGSVRRRLLGAAGASHVEGLPRRLEHLARR